MFTRDFTLRLAVFALAFAIHTTLTGPILYELRYRLKERGERRGYARSRTGVGSQTYARPLPTSICRTAYPLHACRFGGGHHLVEVDTDGSDAREYRLEPNGLLLDEHVEDLLRQQPSAEAQERLRRLALENQLASL